MLSAKDKDAGYKSYRLGTHRTVEPRHTLDRVKSLTRELGITRIANITGLDRIDIPVVMACRPNSRSIAVSQGKGVELDAAKASALMESVETYHAEHITLPLKLASYGELCDSLPIVDVAALPKSQDNRYHDRRPLLWIEGCNWIDRSPLWLPYETVSANYTLPLPPGSGCFAASTNGLASGNHLLEAISHGICEVVERDAATLWKLQRETMRQKQGLDLGTVDDPGCCEILEKFERAGIEIKVWDTTSDVGVAAFICLVSGGEDDWADPEFGSGCHPARGVALLRALTEAAQARTTFIAGTRDDLGPELYSSSARRKRLTYCVAKMRSHRAARDFHAVPTWEPDTIQEDLEWELTRLQSIGIEQVAVVDLIKSQFGLPVVRVVIPGLEGPYDHEGGDYVPGPRAEAAMGLLL